MAATSAKLDSIPQLVQEGEDSDRDESDGPSLSWTGDDSSDNEESEPFGAEFTLDIEQLESDDICYNVELLQNIFDDQARLEQIHLNFQYVDFLSDFGTNEPFLIDGDALVFSAFNNLWLDWQNGGQFLHLVYVVESFLQKLLDRGCQFHIFFLQNNEDVLRHVPSFCLARTIVMHHLMKSCGSLSSTVHLISGSWLGTDLGGCFASCRAAKSDAAQTSSSSSEQQSLDELLNEFRPSFILTNSGHHDENHHKIFAVAQMHFAHQCLIAPVIVITFEDLRFKGSRIFGLLFHPPAPSSRKIMKDFYLSKKFRSATRHSVGFCPRAEWPGPSDLNTRHESAFHPEGTDSALDFRTSVFLPSLCRVVGQNTAAPRTKGCAMTSIACVVLAQRLSHSERNFVLPNRGNRALSELPRLSETVMEFQGSLSFALIDSLQHAFASGLPLDFTVLDIFDGRLLTLMLLQLAAGWALPDWLGDECAHNFTSYSHKGEEIEIRLKHSEVVLFNGVVPSSNNCWWSATQQLLAFTADESQMARDLLDEGAEQVSSTQKRLQLQQAHLRNVGKRDLLSEVLGDVRERMKPFEGESPDGDDLSLGPFFLHHYHRYAYGRGVPESINVCNENH
jgi:hypothetical protein